MPKSKVKKTSGITHCRVCLRTKEEAIEEQRSLGKLCDNEHCVFVREIEEAIDFTKKSIYCIHCGNKFTLVTDKFCTFCGTKRYGDNI